jgi:hypothetical protein
VRRLIGGAGSEVCRRLGGVALIGLAAWEENQTGCQEMDQTGRREMDQTWH